MPVRMVSYHGRIPYQHRLPIYPVVVYLSFKDRKKNIKSTYTSSIGGKRAMAFDYDVVKVWALESGIILEKKLENGVRRPEAQKKEQRHGRPHRRPRARTHIHITLRYLIPLLA